jgi:hypothetical protein
LKAHALPRSIVGVIAAAPVFLFAVMLATAAYPARADNGSVSTANGSIYVHGEHADVRAFN